MAIRNLNDSQAKVLRELSKHDNRMLATDLHIDGMKGPAIGKTLSNLQREGLVEGTKGPKEHSYRWIITESGKSLLSGEMLQASPQITTQIAAPDAPPPTKPDHFVFIVSEQKLQDMLISRLGSGAEENVLLKARIRTLEMTLTEIKRQMDVLRRERDTALEMAEYMEKRIASINEALRGTL